MREKNEEKDHGAVAAVGNDTTVVPAPQLTHAEAEAIRRAIRPLDCGVHYCRYCDAGSATGWIHSSGCAYQWSIVYADAATRIVDRLSGTGNQATTTKDAHGKSSV